jgi:hypothetical protein
MLKACSILYCSVVYEFVALMSEMVLSLRNPFPTFRKNRVFNDLKILVTPDQKHKHFPEIYEPPQNSTRQDGGIQQARRW